MSDALHLACPRCHAANRVLAARLADGARCGRCRTALLPAAPYELDAAGFERHLAANDLPLVVDFWAAWCGPCRLMAPEYAKAAARLALRVRCAKLDTEAAPQIAARFGIRGIPTLIAFAGGRELARRSGALDAAGIVGWVEAHTAQA